MRGNQDCSEESYEEAGTGEFSSFFDQLFARPIRAKDYVRVLQQSDGLWMGMKTKQDRRFTGEEAAYVRRAQLTFAVLMQGKWRIQILCALRRGPIRLGQLGRLIPGASKKVLAQNLRQLETDGIVTRTDLSELILHIEYELQTDIQDAVCTLLDHLSDWGALYLGSTARHQANNSKHSDNRRKSLGLDPES